MKQFESGSILQYEQFEVEPLDSSDYFLQILNCKNYTSRIRYSTCVQIIFYLSATERPNMALKSIYGIWRRKTLGVFRRPQIFMLEITRALCTMNLKVSISTEITISSHSSMINHNILQRIIGINQFYRTWCQKTWRNLVWKPVCRRNRSHCYHHSSIAKFYHVNCRTEWVADIIW